ncbi:peptidase, partial [Pseudonocardia zijingensis]
GWWTVTALIDHLLGPAAPQAEVFPVIDFQGKPIGWLTLADLAAVSVDARPSTAVREVVRPLPQDGIVGVDTPAGEVLRRSIGPAGLVVTQADGRAVGVIGVDDVRRAAELQGLRTGAVRTR